MLSVPDLCCYCLCECLEIGFVVGLKDAFCSPYLIDESLYAVGFVVKQLLFVRKHCCHAQTSFDVNRRQDGYCLFLLKSSEIGEIDLDAGLPAGLLL